MEDALYNGVIRIVVQANMITRPTIPANRIAARCFFITISSSSKSISISSLSFLFFSITTYYYFPFFKLLC